MTAVCGDQVAVMKLLCDKGVDLNIKDLVRILHPNLLFISCSHDVLVVTN